MNDGKNATKFEIREVGRVKSVREFIVRAVNMPSCITGQMVKFSNGSSGLVMGFKENEVQILVLDSKSDIRGGDEVYSTGEPLLLPGGESL